MKLFHVLILCLILAPSAYAQNEVIPHAQDKPPGPALSPAEAINKMTVPPGFTVELVAAEPDIVNPVCMTFDERGRVWICESLEYPRREPGPGRDRVKVLEDTDGDGKADKFQVFADGLNIPSGVAVGHGGVWVANSPDVLFYADADRDAKPDGPPVVVATGFGRDDTHELPNSLVWGPDGWLYGWNGVFNASKVKSNNGKTYDFTCAVWRIHPKTREFQVWSEGTSNPWGIAFNNNGDLFASACVIDHLWHMVESAYYIRQGGPYPPFAWPAPSIVDHKHQKAAYCNITWYDSDAYPPEYRGKLYLGNIHGNCINVDSLEKNGSTYKAKAAPDFLSADDAWFMPVAMKTGPDGCLYVLDWYDRYHCYQDANRDPAGIDRLKGRLYRVRYKDAPRRVGFDLGNLDISALNKLLGSGNGYDREIALRLLQEQFSKTIGRTQGHAQTLRALKPEDEGRPRSLNMVWSLIGSGTHVHREAVITGLLTHSDPTFRAWGVRAAGDAGGINDEIRGKVAKLAKDPAPEVRVQVAIAARKALGGQALPVLMEVLSASGDDPLIPHVVWQNLHPLLAEVDVALLEKSLDTTKVEPRTGIARLAPRILERVLARETPPAKFVAELLASLIDSRDPALARDAIARYVDRVRRSSFDAPDTIALREAVTNATLKYYHPAFGPESSLSGDFELLICCTTPKKRGYEDAQAPRKLFMLRKDERLRIAGLELYLWQRNDAEQLRSMVADVLLDPEFQGSPGFGARVLSTLTASDDPALADTVLKCYPKLEPGLKGNAIALLAEREVWANALLNAIKEKAIPPAAVSLDQLRRIQRLVKDPKLAEFVKATWGTVREGRNERRELVVGQMRNFLHKTPGDPAAGQLVFGRLCAQCHKIYGEGQDVGPDITLNGRNDFEQLLSNVFDPNLVIGQGYQAMNVATKDGRVLAGLVAEDGKERLVLKLQGGKTETIARGDVDEAKLSPISLMPEDVEKQLKPEEIADLFAFLVLDKPPSDPNAKRLPGAPAEKARKVPSPAGSR